MLFTKGSQQCGPFAPNFTKDIKRNFLGMLVILMSMATIRVSAQAFKFSGGLREMLSDPAMSVKLSAPTGERIDVIMKVTDSGQMAAVCAEYGMTMKTDLGAIAVVSIPLDRLLAAAADERVVRIERLHTIRCLYQCCAQCLPECDWCGQLLQSRVAERICH